MNKIMYAIVAVAVLIPGPGEAVAFAEPTITEDMDGWECSTMGNHLCGPGNSTGLLPGRYSVEGLLLEPWNEGMRG